MKKRCFRLRLISLTLLLQIALSPYPFYPMPQFDTFSFFSQLFWVFLGFLFLYLVICFYLLPSLAAILKIRKRKLAQVSSSTDSVSLVTDTSFSVSTKILLDGFNSKLSSLSADNNNTVSTSNLSKTLTAVSISFETSREFNLSVFSQAQITSLLYV